MNRHTYMRFAILRFGFALALVVGILAFATRRVEAIDFSWNAPISGSFLDPTNWNPSGVPGSTDRAIFDLGSAGYTVSLPANSPTTQVGQFVVNNDTLTLDPHQSQFTFASHIGNSSGDVANLTLVDGTVTSTTLIGDSAGSTGTVTIDGSQGAAAWLANTSTIGNAGTGTVRIENGGSMSAQANVLGATSTGVGELDISGVSSVTMLPSTYSGPLSVTKGTGTVNITAGGLANFTTLSLATIAGSQATATVDGSGSVLNASTSFGLGTGRTGTLKITGGGSANVTALNLATAVGSQAVVTVNGSGSVLNVTNSLQLGNGTSTLNISGGGQVSGSTLVTNVGQVTLNVSGAGSLLKTGFSAGSGNTTINISAGGAIQSASSVNLGSSPWTTNVTLSGSGTIWTASDGFGFNAGSGTALIQTGAQLNVTGDTSVGAQGIGQMTVTGTGSQLNTDALFVGATGTTTMLVEKGATVSVTGATSLDASNGGSAQLTLDGAGSNLTTSALNVGNNNSSVVVKNGATAAITGDTIVASNGGPGTLTVSGTGSQFNSASLDFGGQGLLTINAAGIVNVGSLKLGDFTQSVNDSVLVSGAGSQLNVTGNAFISDSQGSFVANQGASVSIASATIGEFLVPGTVSLDGAGTTWQSRYVSVGASGAGSMSITGGATASIGSLDVGGDSTSTLTMSGSGSQITVANSVSIGAGRAPASVSITAGAQASVNAPMSVGDSAAGTLSVDGLGSSWTSTGLLTVGLDAPGIVNITGGATLSSAVGADPNGQSGIIGENSSATASSVTIAGAGSSWIQNGTLIVGQNGQGTMTIRDGGFVQSAAGVIGLDRPDFADLVTVSGAGSTWNLANSLNVGFSCELVVAAGGMVHVAQTLSGNGTVDLSQGGSVIIGPIPVQGDQFDSLTTVGNGTLQIEMGGTLQSAGKILGDVFNSGSISSPPTSIEGSYMQTSSGMLLLTAVGGPFVSSTEMKVSGDAFLSGTIELAFQAVHALPLVVGETFNLVSAGGTITTDGLNLQITGVDPGFAYTTQIEGGVLSLTVTRVPEPGTVIMAALGSLVYLAARLRSVNRNVLLRLA